jgi:hypothetical protein
MLSASRRPILPVALALATAGCGAPTTPEGFPELADAYAGRLEADFTSVPGGVPTSGVPCTVTVTVRAQSGASFQGAYDRGFPCARATYPVTGTVQRDGAVTVDIAGGADAFQGFDECRYVSGDERWRGRLDGDELSLRIDVVLTCAPTGTQRTVATIIGRPAR